jgi:hypothetical protein
LSGGDLENLMVLLDFMVLINLSIPEAVLKWGTLGILDLPAYPGNP